MASPSRMTARITVQRIAQTIVAGAVTSTWTDLATVWARIEWQSAAETVASDQVTVARTVSGQIRFSKNISEVTERDRIVWKGKNLSVNAWLPAPADRPDIINFTATASP